MQLYVWSIYKSNIKILYLAKFIQITFSDKLKLREFIASRLAKQQMTNEIP